LEFFPFIAIKLVFSSNNVSGNSEPPSISGDCFVPFEELCILTWTTVTVWALLLFCTCVLLAKELFQLMHSQRLYFTNWENWVQLCIIVNVALVSFHTDPTEAVGGQGMRLIGRWQHHAAAFGVFLVWGELMLMVKTCILYYKAC